MKNFFHQPLGRKNIILISSIIFTVGSLTMGFAQTSALLIAGRFILGVAIGFSSSTIPVYIAEITQPHQRGTLVANFNLLITGECKVVVKIKLEIQTLNSKVRNSVFSQPVSSAPD